MSDHPVLGRGDAVNLLKLLQERANHLLTQFRAFQAHLKHYSMQKDVEVRTFKRGLESEVKTLNAISFSEGSSPSVALVEDEVEELESKRLHALRSSNLPFYEAVWKVVCECEGITALGKRVYCEVGMKPNFNGPTAAVGEIKPVAGTRSEKRSATVDVISSNGLIWSKVSTITEKRLLFEMAKEGWEAYGDDSDSEQYESDRGSGPGENKQAGRSQLELVKLAKVLFAASRQSRVRFRHPQVRFILPKIGEGLYEDVDAVIADIRSVGVEVICGESEPESISHFDRIASSMAQFHLDNNKNHHRNLDFLLPSPSIFLPSPSPVLNIDCTILLALISDISHIPEHDLPPHPSNVSGTYHKAITRQIGTENDFPLLPHELYPLISGRTLQCTKHAAQRMREIVQTMGTDTERERADIILAENSRSGLSAEHLRQAMGEFSCHSIPSDLNLPIEEVDFNGDIDVGSLHPNGHISSSRNLDSSSQTEFRIMSKVLRRMNLSAINRSVFLYGWTKGIVTVTSNRAVAQGLVRYINEILDEEEQEEQKEGGGRQQQQQQRQGDAQADTDIDRPETEIREASVNGDANEEVEEFEGPKIYVCETARSLIGKEKQGG